MVVVPPEDAARRGWRRGRHHAQRVGPRGAGGGSGRRDDHVRARCGPTVGVARALPGSDRSGRARVPTVPCLPCPSTDTIKVVDADGAVIATPDRARLVAVQTPQAFRAEVLRAGSRRCGATARTMRRSSSGRAGASSRCRASRGTARSPTPRIWPGRSRGWLATVATVTADGDPRRTGVRRSPHRRRPGPPAGARRLPLPGMPGLVGHSDGDAVAHAVAEALLGAAGLGDIGQRFPDTDPALAGADSIELLRKVVAAVRAEGWSVGNADCSVICEAPKLAPMRDEMQAKLSDAVRRTGLGEGPEARAAGRAGAGGGHRLLRRRRARCEVRRERSPPTIERSRPADRRAVGRRRRCAGARTSGATPTHTRQPHQGARWRTDRGPPGGSPAADRRPSTGQGDVAVDRAGRARRVGGRRRRRPRRLGGGQPCRR